MRLVLISLMATALMAGQSNSVQYVNGSLTDGCAVVYSASIKGFTCSPVAGTVPAGSILIINTGTCPATWTEVASLNGVALRGTLAANGDVGTATGSDTATPTVASTSLTAAAQPFTGSGATTSAVSAGTPAGTNSTSTVTPLGTNGASATSGNCAATNIAAGTGSTTACKATAPNLTVTAQTFTGSSSTVGAQTFTGSALGTHTHTLTATGTNGSSAVSGTITLNAVATVPSSIKVIFCSKN